MAKIQSFFFGNGRAVLLGKCSPAFGSVALRVRFNQGYFLKVGGFGIIAQTQVS